MKIYSYILIVIICSFFSNCSTQSQIENDLKDSDNRREIIYHTTKKYAESKNYESLMHLGVLVSRAESDGKLIDALLGMPPSRIDSLKSEFPDRDFYKDSIYSEGAERFISKYGLDAYRELVNYFENDFTPGDYEATLSFVDGLSEDLGDIYLGIAGVIDGSISVSTYHYYLTYGEWECLRALIGAVGESAAMGILAGATTDCLTLVGLPEVSLAIDAIYSCVDLYEAIEAVHQYNECVRTARQGF